MPLLAAGAVPGPGGIGVRLVDVPAAAHSPLARSYIVETLAPGTIVRRRVEVRNSTRSPATVVVYPAAAALTRGNFSFAAGHGRNELSAWTSVSRGVLRLEAGASAFETVTIVVPKAVSRGERYAVVWAEVATPPPVGGGVTLVNRVGVRMYVSIGRGGAAPASFTIGALTAERSAAGALLVVANVHNSGSQTLELSGNLTLSRGPGGLRAGPFPVASTAKLAPGRSELERIRLDPRLPRGPWHAVLRLASGSVERQAVATITFPLAAAAPSDSVARPLIRVGMIMLGLLAVGALLLLLASGRLRVA